MNVQNSYENKLPPAVPDQVGLYLRLESNGLGNAARLLPLGQEPDFRPGPVEPTEATETEAVARVTAEGVQGKNCSMRRLAKTPPARMTPQSFGEPSEDMPGLGEPRESMFSREMIRQVRAQRGD